MHYFHCVMWALQHTSHTSTNIIFVPFHITVLIGHMSWCFRLRLLHAWEVIRTVLLPSASVGNSLQPVAPQQYITHCEWPDWQIVQVNIRSLWIYMGLKAEKYACVHVCARMCVCQHGISEALTA